MPDLDELFKTLDTLPTPDIRGRAASRSADAEPPMPSLGGGRGRRFGTIVVAILVFLVPAAYVWQAARTDTRSTTPASPTSDPLSSIGQGWTELPTPPQLSSGTASVWTGTELIEWGGYTYDAETKKDAYLATGFAFDPVTNAWSAIPPAPQPRSESTPIWTGQEALFLFGHTDATSYPDGFAFDPASNTWRTIAAAPIDPDIATAVWTGSEVIVWGTDARDGNVQAGQGAAYDPTTDTWRRIADAPISLNLARGMWTGDRMIVFGSLLDNGNRAATDTSVGASYDPASDSWTSLPASDLSAQATTAAWTGDRLLAWDYQVRSQTFDPTTNAWSRPIQMPLQASECYPDSVAVSGYVFAFYCGYAAQYDDAAGAWAKIHGGMVEATTQMQGRTYQVWRFADLTPADGVVFLGAVGLTATKDGEPCYGCPGAPTSLWAYRP